MNEWMAEWMQDKGRKKKKRRRGRGKAVPTCWTPTAKAERQSEFGALFPGKSILQSLPPPLSISISPLSPSPLLLLLCTALHWTAVINYAFPAAKAAAAKAAEAMLHSSPQSSVETKEEEEGLNFVYTVSGTIACHYCHSFKWLRSVRAQTQTETDGDTGRQWRGIEALGVQH